MMKYSIFSLFLSKPSSQRARLSRKPRCRCTQTVTKPTRDPTNLWLTYLFAARRTFVFRVRYAALRRDPVRHPGFSPAHLNLSEAVKRRLAAGPPHRSHHFAVFDQSPDQTNFYPRRASAQLPIEQHGHDGCAQKLGNDLRHDSKSIATTVCNQIGRK